MKKHLHIFLAFQVLATSSPTSQGMETLLKMGAFFHHFAHHLLCHQENIGIVNFVQLHYSDHEHHEEDHAEHENLPFQHHHHDQQNLVAQVLFLMPPQPVALFFFRAESFSNPPVEQSQQRLFSLHLSDIWQPPKA